MNILYFEKLHFSKESNGEMEVKMNPSSYSALVGTPVTMTCEMTNAQPIDIVWIYYPAATPNKTSTIYFENNYLNGLQSIFSVTLTMSGSDLITYLTIPDVKLKDSLYVYECQCNIYRLTNFSISVYLYVSSKG